jgi:hypothetical protein
MAMAYKACLSLHRFGDLLGACDCVRCRGFRHLEDAVSEPYEALKRMGHSPAKAAEIVLDASRGDEFSQLWIAHALRIDADPEEAIIQDAYNERSRSNG